MQKRGCLHLCHVFHALRISSTALHTPLPNSMLACDIVIMHILDIVVLPMWMIFQGFQ